MGNEVLGKMIKKLFREVNKFRKSADYVLNTITHNQIFLKRVLMQCPICDNLEAYILHYGSFRTSRGNKLASHNKYICAKCSHVYSNWFHTETNKMGELYANFFHDRPWPIAPNPRKKAQEELINMLIQKRDKDGDYLDFACGSNFSIAYEMREKDVNVFACDIRNDLPYDNEILFKCTPSKPFDEKFDGISSIDAIEHIQNIYETWKFFNKSLKKDGLMVHSFPTTFKYSYAHYFFRIPFHFCLFSKESLLLWCDKMGFEYLGEENLHGSDVGECYWFKKCRDLK